MGITFSDPDVDANEHTIQIAALTPADNAVIIGNGTAWTAESGGTLRASIGLAIGVDVQAYAVSLDAWAGASPSDYLTTVAAAAAYQPLAARLTEIVATGITTAMFATNVVDNDSSLAANSSTRLVTQAAAKAYMDDRIAAQDAMVFKGVIDCSANPNYPAADRGWTYKVSVAGKIGGASGPNVEVGDMLLCITDSTATGNHATVGANWNISQNNVDGAVTGPASSTAGNVPTFNGTSGKVLQDSGFTINQSLATTSSPTFAGATFTDDVRFNTAPGPQFNNPYIGWYNAAGTRKGYMQALSASAFLIAAESDTVGVRFNTNGGVASVDGDPVMTRGAAETVTGVKTHSTHINLTAGAINLSGSGSINADNALHLFFNSSAGKIQALENGVAWRNLDVDGATITLNGVNTSGSVAVGSGMVIGAPTGGNKGVGTLNATAVYDDNSLLTCYIIEAWKYGAIDLAKWDALTPNREHPAKYETVETGERDADDKPLTERRLVAEAWTEVREHAPARGFAKVAADRLDIDKFAQFVRDNERLPAFPAPDRWEEMYSGKMATGDLIQRLWETVEVMAVHSIEARKRELALTARVEALEAAQ